VKDDRIPLADGGQEGGGQEAGGPSRREFLKKITVEGH